LNNAKTVVVIPALNEEKTIGNVVESARKFAETVIIVDDGSSDETAEIASKAGAIVVRNEKNLGYDASIEKGFEKAVKEDNLVIITMDADGQHFAEDIPKFTTPIFEGKADIVMGIRDTVPRFSEKIFRIYFSRFGIRDPLCGFKAYKANVFIQEEFFDSLNLIGTELVLISALKGRKIMQVKIKTRKRSDKPRFGSSVKANLKILYVLMKIIVRYGFKRRKNRN